MIKKRRTPDMDKLLHYDGLLVGKLHYRALLNDVGTGDNVASPTTSQYGKIVKVIRNKYGIPVCYKVKYYDEYDGGGKPINPDNWGTIIFPWTESKNATCLTSGAMSSMECIIMTKNCKR